MKSRTDQPFKKPFKSLICRIYMPTFLDSHKMGNVTEEQLRQAMKAPRDEYGVTNKNIYYNKAEDKAFCVLDAPDKEAIQKHHQKIGLSCDSITEVQSTA